MYYTPEYSSEILHMSLKWPDVVPHKINLVRSLTFSSQFRPVIFPFPHFHFLTVNSCVVFEFSEEARALLMRSCGFYLALPSPWPHNHTTLEFTDISNDNDKTSISQSRPRTCRGASRESCSSQPAAQSESSYPKSKFAIMGPERVRDVAEQVLQIECSIEELGADCGGLLAK